MSLVLWILVTFLVACCQIGTVLSGLAEPEPDENPCPSGAEYYFSANKCYVVRHKMVNRNIAERNCENMGGILAIIDDFYQQNFINSITKSYNYWIGPNDQNKSRVYENPDGTIPSYFKWDDTSNGQPNDDVIANDQGCVNLTPTKYWHDNECDVPERYICQLKEARTFLALKFILITVSEFMDGDWYSTHSTVSRIYCQVLCVSYPVCIGYTWNPDIKNMNCHLIRPMIGNLIKAYPGEVMYEVIER